LLSHLRGLSVTRRRGILVAIMLELGPRLTDETLDMHDGYVNEPWPTLLTKVGPPNGALFMSDFGCRRGFF
jgi:hypothetical protein